MVYKYSNSKDTLVFIYIQAFCFGHCVTIEKMTINIYLQFGRSYSDMPPFQGSYLWVCLTQAFIRLRSLRPGLCYMFSVKTWVTTSIRT